MSNSIRINAELTGASVNINTNLNAAGLEELIRMLAQTRAKMQPPVAKEQSDIAATGAPSLLEDLSRLAFERPDSNGTAILRLRSEGLGWLGFRMQRADCEGLRDFLQSHFPAINEVAPTPHEQRH